MTSDEAVPGTSEPHPPKESLGRLFVRFLRFGFLAWGGPVAQIAMVRQKSVGFSPERQTLFRLASNRTTLNPWYLIFSVGGRTYCASTSVDTCKAALAKMGYSSTTVVW